MRPRNFVQAAIAVILLACAPPAASAAVPGLQLVEAGSGASSQSKPAEAQCPDDQDLLGVGGHVTGGANQVILDALSPSLDGVEVHASERQGGTSGDWTVRALAICADEPVGAEVRSTTFPFPDGDSSSPKTVSTAAAGPCTNEHRLTGAGAEILDLEGQVVLDRILPSPDLESSSARAVEDQDGTDADWRIRAHAICSATTLPGLERVVRTGPSNSRDKHATARCPEGKRVVGTGGEIVGGQGQVGFTYVLPEADLTRVHVRGAEDRDGFGGDWSVRAIAVCATA
jgi:hypothetical protein